MERETYNLVKEYYSKREFDEAYKLLWQLANDGDSEAMFEFAVLYEFAYTNREKAAEWYKKAIDAGFAKAMYNLGLLYEFEKKYDESKCWYEQAANTLNTSAMLRLGIIYRNYEPRDPQKALEWFTRAYELGNADAALNIAQMYEEGVIH